MKTNKKNAGIGILIVFTLLLCSYVSAFGVGSAYHKDQPLEMFPGETREINFRLQNMPGPENITVRPSISKGSEIMTLLSSGDILVPVGGSVDVKATVSVPSTAQVGDIYPVEISFTTVTLTGAGTFGLGSSVGRGFNVIVVPEVRTVEEPAAEKNYSWIIYVIVIVAILIIVWIILKKKKK